MRIAILDLGTNTFHLLIAETDKNNNIQFLFSEQRFVKIGKSVILKGVLEPSALNRAEEAITHYARIIENYKVDSSHAFATAAIRTASNGNDLLQMVIEKTGAEVKTISGEREAELIWNGARHAVRLSMEPALIMDIGGGSVEFIIGNHEKIFRKSSYPIGGAMMIEKFKISDKVTADEITTLERFWKETLLELIHEAKKYSVLKLIGSAGSFESFAEIILHSEKQEHNPRGTYFEIKSKDFEKLFNKLLKSDSDRRMKMPGLPCERADMIVPAILLTNFIRKQLHFSQLYVSRYALKEGAAFELLQRK